MLGELKEVEHEKTEKKKNDRVPQFKKFLRVSQQKLIVCYVEISVALIRPRFSKTRPLLLCCNIARNRTITGSTLVASRAEMRTDG